VPVTDSRPAWTGEPDSLIVTTDTGDRLHYLDWGGPEQPPPALPATPDLPPLLLIHGLGQTGWIWAPICRRLRSVTRVLVPDLRGHGLSDSPRSGYDLESLAFDALTVLAANGWGVEVGGLSAAVAGHGLGAMVAATMADIQPESVCAVALVDGGWEDLAEATGMTAAEFERGLGDPPEVLASMDAFLADRREFDPSSWDADQERAARATVEEKHAGHVAQVTRGFALRGCIGAMFDYQPLDVLGRVAQPLLVAVADSDSADDEGQRERLLALDDVMRRRRELGLAAPTVERLAGAGHNLMRYRPVELSAAIERVVREGADLTTDRAPGDPA
jgi:pimeloyl-ACP methyl ester carboxylesterase